MKRFIILIFILSYQLQLLGSQPVGLRNRGNTCFMNAVIQCLFNIDPLTEFLLKNQSLYNEKEPNKTYKTVAWEYINLLKELNKRSSPIEPITFCYPMWESMKLPERTEKEYAEALVKNPNLKFKSQGLQQDAGEFLTKILDHITVEDFNKEKIKYWYGYPFNNIPQTKLIDLLCIISLEKLIKTNSTSEKYEFKNQFNLPIKDKDTKEKYEDINICLKKYFSVEKTDLGPKQYFIKTSPDYLILILNRFEMNEYGITTKISDPVKLNNTIDLDSYFIPNSKIIGSTKYELMSFVLHSGSFDEGHYTACVKRQENWYLLDDLSSTQENVDDFINKGESSTLKIGTPYIIFYKKIEPGSTTVDLSIDKFDEKTLISILEKSGYSPEQLDSFLDAKRIDLNSLLKGINQGFYTIKELENGIADLFTGEKLLKQLEDNDISVANLNDFLKLKNISLKDLIKNINKGQQSISKLHKELYNFNNLKDIDNLIKLQNELNLLESLAKK